MTVREAELEQIVLKLRGHCDSCDALLRRIKPATLDRGFWSVSLERLCEDAEDLVERYQSVYSHV